MNKLETFRNPNGYSLNQLISKEPSCFNGIVNVEKYEITCTKINESKEVYCQRLQKLWEECNNHHNWEPLTLKAKELGIELIGRPGSKNKK